MLRDKSNNNMGLLRQGGFKFSRREIAQAGMNPFTIIDISEKASDLLVGIVKVLVVRQVDFFFLNGADDAFSVAILPSCAHIGHANRDFGIVEQVNIGGGGILPPLVGVMNFRGRPLQGHLQSVQRQRLIQTMGQMPAANAASKDIHDDGEIDELVGETDKSNIGNPHLMGPCDGQILDEIGIATIAMLRVRGSYLALWYLSLQSHLLHQPADALMIDLSAFTLQLRRQASIAIGRPRLGLGQQSSS